MWRDGEPNMRQVLWGWKDWQWRQVSMVGQPCRWKFTKNKERGHRTPWVAATRKKIDSRF
jgi:hypothetical protein